MINISPFLRLHRLSTFVCNVALIESMNFSCLNLKSQFCPLNHLLLEANLAFYTNVCLCLLT